jgi:hypothetical protein
MNIAELIAAGYENITFATKNSGYDYEKSIQILNFFKVKKITRVQQTFVNKKEAEMAFQTWEKDTEWLQDSYLRFKEMGHCVPINTIKLLLREKNLLPSYRQTKYRPYKKDVNMVVKAHIEATICRLNSFLEQLNQK